MPLTANLRDWDIYKIISPTNRIYIGITTNFNKRVYHYKKLDCTHQTALYYSLKKYGFDSHSVSIIDKFTSTISSAYDKEMFWIRTYMSNYAKFPQQNGLNLTNGGRGSHGVIVSEATKEKIRKANLGKKYPEETKRKLSEVRRGKKIKSGWTEEKRIKMSELRKGFKHTEEARNKISEAGKGNKYNLGRKQSKETIEKRCLKLRGNKANLGRIHPLEERLRRADKLCKPILKFSLSGEFIKEYKSCGEAAKDSNVSKWLIWASLNNKVKNPKKYIFKLK